jgi:hypothetical protein
VNTPDERDAFPVDSLSRPRATSPRLACGRVTSPAQVGANQTTRLKTEVPLVFAARSLPAGAYSVFVDLKENAWTLIFSSWPVQATYDERNARALWGAFGYTPDKDVLRTPMTLGTLPFSMPPRSRVFTRGV